MRCWRLAVAAVADDPPGEWHRFRWWPHRQSPRRPPTWINRSFSLNPYRGYVRQYPLNVGGEFMGEAVAVGDVTGDGGCDVAVGDRRCRGADVMAGTARASSWYFARRRTDLDAPSPCDIWIPIPGRFRRYGPVRSRPQRCHGDRGRPPGRGCRWFVTPRRCRFWRATKIVDERQYNPGLFSLCSRGLLTAMANPMRLQARTWSTAPCSKGDGAGGLSAREVDGIPIRAGPISLAREMNGDGEARPGHLQWRLVGPAAQ